MFYILYLVVSTSLIHHIFQTLFTKVILIAFIVEDSLFVRWYSSVTRDFHLLLLYQGELNIVVCLLGELYVHEVLSSSSSANPEQPDYDDAQVL